MEAWLNTTPESEDSKGKRTAQPTRLTAMRRDRKDPDFYPPMPDVEGAEWLLAMFWQAGPAVPAGMGRSAITWQEIQAFEHLSGLELQPWEALLMRRLSAAYVDESYSAQKPSAQAPWRTEDAPINTGAAVATASLRAAIGAMAKKS